MADEDIRIRAELEGALERDVQGATDAVGDLGTQATETAAQLRIMEAAAAGASRQVGDLERQSRQAQREVRQIGKSSSESAKDTDKGTSALERLHAMVEKFKGGGRGGIDFGKLFSIYKIPAIVTAVTLLATSLSAVAAAGVAAVGGLSPMVGLAAALPAGLLAGAQAMGAVKLATQGFGDAVQAMMKPGASPDDVAKALAGLTPPAQTAALYVGKLVNGPLKAMQRSAAAGFFPGFTGGLVRASALIPVLNRNLTDTATAMGGLAREAGTVAGSPMFQSELGRVMANNTGVLVNGGRAGGNLALALLHVVDAFRPVLTDMSVYALRGARFLELTTRMGDETGRMGGFFQRAWDLAKATGSVLADVSVGIFNITRGSTAMSDHLGGGIERGAKAFREWTASISGQNSIQRWFQDAIPVVDALLRLVGHVIVAFSTLATNQQLVPVINQLTDQLLPAILSLATGVSNQFGPAIVQAATAFVQFQSALTFTPLAVILMAVAKAASFATSVFSGMPGPVRTVIAVILALSLATRLLSVGAGAAAKGFAPLVDGIRGFRGTAGDAEGRMSGMARAGQHLGDAVDRVKLGMWSYGRALEQTTAAQGRTASASERFGARFQGAMAGVRQSGRLALGGVRSAVGGLSGALGGPWGIAITAAIAGIGAFSAHQAQAKADVQALTGSLNQQTGAVTRNTLQTQLQKLQQKGWLDYAQKAGISLPEITRALNGNSGAMAEVERKANAAHGGVDHFLGSIAGGTDDLSEFKNTIRDSAGQISLSQKQWRQLHDAMTGVTGATRKNRNETNAADRTEQAMAHAHQRAANMAHGQATQTDRLTAAAKRLKAITSANIGGQIAFRQSIADASKQLDHGRRTMNLHTQAGRDNQSAMVAVADAAKGVAREAGRQKAVDEARKKITAWATQAGWGKKRADEYARGLLGLKQSADRVPTRVHTDVTVSGTDQAVRNARRVRDALKEIHSAHPRVDIGGVIAAQQQAANVRSTLNDLRGVYPRFAGGPVDPSNRYMVGELGPELYRDVIGRVEVVGAHGPEQRTFPTRGEILPNAVYEAAKATELAVPAGVLAALDRTGAGGAAPSPPSSSTDQNMFAAAVPPVNIAVNATSNVDVEAAVRRGVAAALADERRRRINHGGS